MKTIFGIVLGIFLSTILGIALMAQAPTSTTASVSLAPPPLPWLVIYPRDANDQAFRQAPARILVGRNTPDDLEICIERTEVTCLTIGRILELAAVQIVAPPTGQ